MEVKAGNPKKKNSENCVSSLFHSIQLTGANGRSRMCFWSEWGSSYLVSPIRWTIWLYDVIYRQSYNSILNDYHITKQKHSTLCDFTDCSLIVKIARRHKISNGDQEGWNRRLWPCRQKLGHDLCQPRISGNFISFQMQLTIPYRNDSPNLDFTSSTLHCFKL